MMPPQKEGRYEDRWRVLAAICIVMSIPGIGLLFSGILRSFERGASGHYVQILWNAFLLVAVALTYRELFRRLSGRSAEGKRPYAWLYCGLVNAFWLSALCPESPLSSTSLNAVIAIASGTALFVSIVALTIEYRALSGRSEL